MKTTKDERAEMQAELVEVRSRMENARNLLMIMRRMTGDSGVVKINIRHKEEQLRQLAEEEKRIMERLEETPKADTRQADAWIKDRQPEKAGVYRVMRRGIGGRPDYEDQCSYAQGLWRNRQGTVINSVTAWQEEGKGGGADGETQPRV